MTLGFREIEHSALYAGLGVQLIDEFESVPSQGFEAPTLGWIALDLEIDDGRGWRAVDHVPTRTASGVLWFPYLERTADARGRQPRKYRVRVAAQFYTPRYLFDAEGVEVEVAPYDDVNPPASVPAMAQKIGLLPAATYPYADQIPVLRGEVVDPAGAPVVNALVSWSDAALQTDAVLSDADGEFSLPMRRAPHDLPIDIHAERPPPPASGRSGTTIIRIPQDLSSFHTIQIS
jgi:hypothetical protein